MQIRRQNTPRIVRTYRVVRENIHSQYMTFLIYKLIVLAANILLCEGLINLLEEQASAGIAAGSKAAHDYFELNKQVVRTFERFILYVRLIDLTRDDLGLHIPNWTCINWLIRIFFITAQCMMLFILYGVFHFVKDCLCMWYGDLWIFWRFSLWGEIGWLNGIIAVIFSKMLLVILLSIVAIPIVLCLWCYCDIAFNGILVIGALLFSPLIALASFGAIPVGMVCLLHGPEERRRRVEEPGPNALAFKRQLSERIEARTHTSPFAASRECPICLEQFDPEAQVV